jgi:ABC-type multidrug transport system ATPase subunit
MTQVLKINQLSKTFGRIKAVQQLDLTISSGQVFGLLGPNGSGKTTTLGMILDVVAPTSGEYTWFDGMEPVQARKQIGSILETPCFYPYLSATQNLRIAAHIKECSFDRIDEVLKQVNLYDRRNDNFKTFSLGMKQRLSIGAALLSDPPVLILDEPTNGLDPEGIAEVRELIKNISATGKTIVLASHLLDEVQKVCTDFCVLKRGKKLYEGPVQAILGETNVVEAATADMELLSATLNDQSWITSVTNDGKMLQLELAEGKVAEDINKVCFDKGIVLHRLLTRTNSLEQEFLKILKEND